MFLVLVSTIIASVYGADQEHHHRPNILFIMTDQMRFDVIRRVQDELRRYDNSTKINTPALDRLISEGAYFRNAHIVNLQFAHQLEPHFEQDALLNGRECNTMIWLIKKGKYRFLPIE